MKKASYKVGDPMDMGFIQIRECRGKKGFCKTDEKTLRESIEEYPWLVDQLVDMASGILMCVHEERLPVHKPAFLLQFEELQRKQRETTKEDDSIRFQLDDTTRELAKLKEELKKEREYGDFIRPEYDRVHRENMRLKEELKNVRRRGEGHGFELDDARREINRLRDENARLKRDLQRYESISLG